MARRLLDYVYLAIVGTQLFGMLALDLVPFYPKPLWQPPSSPLHFLVTLRTLYVSLSSDPFFAEASHDQPWFQAFLYIEALAQFPLAVYLVLQLASSAGRSTTGRTELAGLVFASLTAMGSVTCCYHLVQLGPEVVSAEKKALLLYGEYLPFAVIPVIMGVDMYSRLLARIDQSEKAKKQ